MTAVPYATISLIVPDNSELSKRIDRTAVAPMSVAFWTSRRMLDLGGWDWSIHTASTISAGPRAGAAGVVTFWICAVLAVFGAFTRRAREAPLWFWSVPLLMYLSVVFLVVETPRYRTAIDPFVIILAALAVSAVAAKRAKVP